MISKNFPRYILLLLCFVSSQIAFGQSFTLQGKVADKDGNPIELASVMVVSQGKLSMTNLKGEFSMQLQSEDSVKIRFSMVGYKTKTRVLLWPKGKQTLLVQLSDDSQLQEVVVEGKAKQHGTTEELDVKKTKQGPSATGNAVEELVQTQAGVPPIRSFHHSIMFAEEPSMRTPYTSIMLKFSVLSSSEVVNKKAYQSSILTWLTASDSPQEASKQSMGTR